MKTLLVIAWRNLWRQTRRSLITATFPQGWCTSGSITLSAMRFSSRARSSGQKNARKNSQSNAILLPPRICAMCHGLPCF